MDIREITNPHDKIYINYDDVDAARLAVFIVGHGAYGIDGENGLPLMLFSDPDIWCNGEYGVGFAEWMETISTDRLVAALESFELRGERSSLSDPVSTAHDIAAKMREVK